ncbi:MAG: isoprenoid biosynthesis glyoxalase ElbB [Coraliomargarita sp.]
MKKVAVILSGCGVYDGAEIHESVLTLLTLSQAGAEITCAAPDIPQTQVIDHRQGDAAAGPTRNVLTEAARIARGQIVPVDQLKVEDFDAILFPGGFGAAKNLCTLAFDGPAYTVEPSIANLVAAAHSAGKTLGFMCIAPAIGAAVLGAKGVQLTIGNDKGTAAALESKGARHIECPVDEIVVDEALKVVTSPAYMLAQSIAEAEVGIRKLVRKVLEIA